LAVAWAGPVAGGLDIGENLALFKVLAGPSGNTWASIAAAASWPKWLLVGSAVLYLVPALVAWLVADRRRKRPPTRRNVTNGSSR
jgi:high-affinity Fe2+/Pb2+ permease